MMCSNGMRLARASRVSVGDVRRPPVTARVPALCTLISFPVIIAVPLIALGRFHLSAGGGWYQTSAPYRIFGSTTPMYRRLAYFGVTPQLGLAICLICTAQFDPFSSTCAHCCDQLRC